MSVQPKQHSTSPFYCYAPHARVIMDFLRSMEVTPMLMHAVTTRHPLMGLERVTFFTVKGHPETIPAEIVDILSHLGAIMVEIDDTFARQRAMRRHAAERPSGN